MIIKSPTRVLARKSSDTPKTSTTPELSAIDHAQQHPGRIRNGIALYSSINIIFIVLVILLSTYGHTHDHNPALYLILLVALLTSPFLYVRSFTGPYMVLLITVPFFFGMFALGDLVAYFSEIATIHSSKTRSLISYGEGGVLTGILALYLGYTAAVGNLRSKSARWLHNDWPTTTTLISGLIFFALGLYSTFVAQINLSAFQMMPAPRMNMLEANALVLGRMIGELGEILLAYVLVSTRLRTVKLIIISLIIFKLPLGIILNSKYIGVSFIIIYIVIKWILSKHAPWKSMLVWGIAIALMFPLAYAYRVYMNQNFVSVGKTLEDISGNLNNALSKEVSEQRESGLSDALLDGLTSIAQRSNMKPSVELLMDRVGKDIPYQGGYTLAPLLYVLIPRIILPDKPEAPVGQMFNQEFELSPTPETWISTSFIGELYWNFSWPGIIIGMLLVGYTYGAIGSITSLDAHTNVARILVILTLIATLVFKFQTGIAQQYSVFIRSSILILILHAILRKRKNII